MDKSDIDVYRESIKRRRGSLIERIGISVATLVPIYVIINSFMPFIYSQTLKPFNPFIYSTYFLAMDMISLGRKIKKKSDEYQECNPYFLPVE